MYCLEKIPHHREALTNIFELFLSCTKLTRVSSDITTPISQNKPPAIQTWTW